MFRLDCVEKFLDTAYTIFLCYVGKFGWRIIKDQDGITKHIPTMEETLGTVIASGEDYFEGDSA